MSKQVNFFMGPADEAAFLEVVGEAGASIHAFSSPDPKFPRLQALGPTTDDGGQWRFKISEGGGGASAWRDTDWRWYARAGFEFARSAPHRGMIFMGRIHTKQPTPVYDTCAKWLRGKFKGQGVFHYGPQAVALHAEGVHMNQSTVPWEVPWLECAFCFKRVAVPGLPL